MNKKHPASDDEIVKKVVDGDKELYGEIIDRYEKPLKRYAMGIVFSDAAAADVVQEAFIKSYVNLRSYKPGKKFSSWIYRITHNEAINHIRKNKKELTTSEENWFERLIDKSESIEDLLDKKSEISELLRALKTLKTKYREPLMLHVFEGKSYEDISEIMHLPSATVGTRINRAKKQLKDTIGRRK